MNKIFIFTLGAAVGSVVTWKLVKDKYARIAQEEIDSVKEVFSRRNKPEEPVEEKDEEPVPTSEAVAEYKSIINNCGFSKGRRVNTNCGYSVVERVETMYDKPYVIEPEIFGEDPDYETISLTYYADGVLTDENNCIIDPGEIESLIGEESLDHFGEYEDDSVFVRNEERKTDYEILAVPGNYDD